MALRGGFAVPASGLTIVDLPDLPLTLTFMANEAQTTRVKTLALDVAGVKAGDWLDVKPLAQMVTGYGKPFAYSLADGKVIVGVTVPPSQAAGTVSVTFGLRAIRRA